MIPALLVAVLVLLAKYWLHVAVFSAAAVLCVGMHRRTQQINRDREEMRRHVNEASR